MTAPLACVQGALDRYYASLAGLYKNVVPSFYPQQHLLSRLRNLGEELRERTNNELTMTLSPCNESGAMGQDPSRMFIFKRLSKFTHSFLVSVGNATDERFCSLAINPNLHLKMCINASFQRKASSYENDLYV